MRIDRRYLIAGATACVLALGGVGIAQAIGGDDESASVSGPAAERARAAALAEVPGQAGAVERDSEDGATWEVEVTRADGAQVDVRLDERYQVVGVDGDDEAADDGEAGDG